MHRLVLLCTATYGEGEPTISATNFVSYITGMGDSAHEKRPLQARLLSLESEEKRHAVQMEKMIVMGV